MFNKVFSKIVPFVREVENIVDLNNNRWQYGAFVLHAG